MKQCKWFLLSISLLLSFVVAKQCNVKYVVVAPKFARVGQDYKFAISTFSEHKLKYTLAVQIQNGDSTLTNKNFSLHTGSTSLLVLSLPKEIPQNSYTLYVASNELEFKENNAITINRKVHSIFIQTDKYFYKPGQTVLYRVIATDPNLKPFTDPINITIFDTTQNKIVKLLGQTNEAGVITNELHLSAITPLGQWKILAETKFGTSEKQFEVNEYVLPKFKVDLNLPSFYFINTNNPSLQEDLHLSVTATYTFGEPVKGTAYVVIKLSYTPADPPPTIMKFINLKTGKGDISLTMEELKTLLQGSFSQSLEYQTLSVEVNVTETVTGIVLSSSGSLMCQPNRFNFQFLTNSADNYKPGLPYFGYLSLTQSDGTPPHLSDITDSNGKLKFIDIKATFNQNGWAEQTFKNVTAQLTETGQASFFIDTDSTSSNINFQATFYDEVAIKTVEAYKYITKFLTNNNGGIQISLENSEKIIKPLMTATISVKSVEEIKLINYQLLGKGRIVEAKQIEFKKTGKEQSFAIQISKNMALQLAPEARLVAYYVSNSGELIADSLAVNVIDYFLNKVSLSFNKNATEPGDSGIVLNVKASKNSFVGLLAVDQSVLLLSTQNEFTQEVVKDELMTYVNIPYDDGPIFPMRGGFRPMPMIRRKRCVGCGRWWPIWLGGSSTIEVINKAGMFVLTNLNVYREPVFDFPVMMPMFAMREKVLEDVELGASPDGQTNVKVRTDFPETWIWSDITVNAKGIYQLKLKTPDTITSWIASGFAVSNVDGLGITETPAKLTVIKPFFISLNLPYSIIRGEEFALQVTVFNYFGKDLDVVVTLKASSYFKVRQCTTKQLSSTDSKKSIKVANNDAASVYFWVVASSLGQIPFEVHALAGLAADAIKQTLLVKPEGRPESYSTSTLIQLASGEIYDSSLIVNLPPAGVLVPGSVKILVTAIGDIMGSSLSGIENLLQMPYGCGEQNMLNLVPDVYLLQYLTESGQLTAEFEQKAKTFILDGYQRELTYQRDDGSFSAFGNSDQAGSVWLSSFVIKSFHQAKEYIPVEDDKIAKTLNWITSLQNANGSFSEPPGGRVIHTDMQGGSSSGVALTAYVLIALLENKDNPQVSAADLKSSISNAAKYLEEQYSSYSSDPYALAIIAYALFEANSPKLNDVLSLLDELAINKDGYKYWEKKEEDSMKPIWSSPYLQSKSFNIEITSYALLVYAKRNDLQNSLPIIKWLVKQRNAFGGFSSTQDTVLALEALSSVASFFAPSPVNAGVTITIQGNQDSTPFIFATITKNNSLSLQSTELSENTTSVDVHGTGAGVALLQLIVQYNVEVTNKAQFLSLQLSTIVSKKELTLEISTNWSGDEVSGMVIVEVNLLTGYSISNEKEIIQQIGSTFKKFEQTFNKIIIYLDELTSDKLVFDVKISEMLPVANVKPAAVKVYRYYDPSSFVSGFYSPSGGQTWQGACPLCCGKQ